MEYWIWDSQGDLEGTDRRGHSTDRHDRRQWMDYNLVSVKKRRNSDALYVVMTVNNLGASFTLTDEELTQFSNAVESILNSLRHGQQTGQVGAKRNPSRLS